MARRSIEEPVLLERFVTLIPGPYWLAALVWAVAIPSGLVFDAIAAAVTGKSALSITTLPNTMLNLLFIFYAFLMVRYIRLRVVAAESRIAPRLLGGTDKYQHAFGRMTRTLPPLVLSIVLSSFLLYTYATAGVFTSLWLIPPNMIVVFLATFSATTYLWEFASASWGLHKLGGNSLQLASFVEDRMMGTKPLGNLALSLTIAYFGEILIAILLFSTIPTFNIGSIIVFTIFLILGIGLFFLPLDSIHARMQNEKRDLMQQISKRYPPFRQESQPAAQNATLNDIHTRLAKLTDLREVEMLERKITALPTWPFDVQLVSKFITIVLSVSAVLLSRILTNYILHI